MFLGIRLDSTEKIVGTPTEVYVVQSIRRVTPDRRFNFDLLTSIKGLPWKLRPDSESDVLPDELPEPIVLRPEVPEHRAAPPEPAQTKQAVKQFYITKTLLEKYGWTPGCPACDSTMSGRREGGKFHTPECRSRIEAAVEANDADRVRLTASYAKQHETESMRKRDAAEYRQDSSKTA